MFWLKQFFPYFRPRWAIVWTLVFVTVVALFSRYFMALVGSVVFILYLAQSTGDWRKFALVSVIGGTAIWLVFFHFTF